MRTEIAFFQRQSMSVLFISAMTTTDQRKSTQCAFAGFCDIARLAAAYVSTVYESRISYRDGASVVGCRSPLWARLMLIAACRRVN